MSEEDLAIIKGIAWLLIKRNEACRREIGRRIDDYLGLGFIALEVARRHYDPSKGSWEKYLKTVVYNHIRSEAAESRLVRIPESVLSEAVKDRREGRESDGARQQALWWVDHTPEGLGQLLSPPPARPDEESSDLGDLLGLLNETERSVITRKFGLDGEPPWGAGKISRRLKIAYKRVEHITNRSLLKLRDAIEQGRHP